jgi:hypothetical protein
MSTAIPTPKSPEEIRVEMKARFDAVNSAAEERWQHRHNTSELTAVEKDRQQVKPEAEAAGMRGLGENDSLGG